MRSVSVRRPSHATVIAYLALFVALAGTAVAAKKIQSRDIAKNAVKTNKIADAAVSNRKIANFAVNTSKLADEAVTEDQLAPDSVSGNKIQQSSIGTGKLREGAVETDKIADLAVTNPKLADGAVTGSKVADGAVTAAKVSGPLGLGSVAAILTEETIDPGAALDPGCEFQDVLVPGIQNGDSVLVLPRYPPPSALSSVIYPVAGYSTVANTVSIGVCNPTNATIMNPGAQPVTIAVFG
jgi:hypothetical protein